MKKEFNRWLWHGNNKWKSKERKKGRKYDIGRPFIFLYLAIKMLLEFKETSFVCYMERVQMEHCFPKTDTRVTPHASLSCSILQFGPLWTPYYTRSPWTCTGTFGILFNHIWLIFSTSEYAQTLLKTLQDIATLSYPNDDQVKYYFLSIAPYIHANIDHRSGWSCVGCFACWTTMHIRTTW